MPVFFPAIDPDEQSIQPLVQLVDSLRPKHRDDTQSAARQVQALCQHLREHRDIAAQFRQYLLGLLASRSHTSLYTDTGVLSNEGFFSELFTRIAYRLLPPAVGDVFLADVLDEIFYLRTDYRWIRSVPDQDWLALFDVIAEAVPSDRPQYQGQHQEPNTNQTPYQPPIALQGILDAIRTLSYRISAIGMEPRLARIHNEIEKFESPFLMQSIEINQYLDGYAKLLQGDMTQSEDASHCLVMLDQCDTIISKIRKNAVHHGTSVSLTYLLVALSENMERLRKLLFLTDIKRQLPIPEKAEKTENSSHLAAPTQDEQQIEAIRHTHRLAALALALELIEAHNNRYAVRELFSKNIDLLARNVTENASRTGEHYIAESRPVYANMFFSSAGAGMVVGVMALFKILASYLRAAPLIEAFLFSLNYSFGFMLIHVLHFTVATKQPAMTAAHIAAGLHSKNQQQLDLDSVVELTVKVVRTQFVAVLGNLVTAMPVALLIALVARAYRGEHLVSVEKARHLLHDIDPFSSLSLFYAMIAGVCLFLAGLISGYYDNQALYTRMANRVMQLRRLGKIIGHKRLQKLGNYLENNLGGLMGNFYFGILLGCMATLGDLLGLPIDIRHVTFSAANFVTALVGLDFQLDWREVLTGFLGLVGIGAVNLLVSFSLALWVALRARGARFQQGFMLLRLLIKRFLRQPCDFFIFPSNRNS